MEKRGGKFRVANRNGKVVKVFAKSPIEAMVRAVKKHHWNASDIEGKPYRVATRQQRNRMKGKA